MHMTNLYNKVLAFFKDPFKVKEKLPQGVAEFHTWAESIITHYGLPLNNSVKFAIATLILHAKEDAAYLSKEYFGLRALKSAANQVAAGVMQDLKNEQARLIKEAEDKEAEEKAKAEAEAKALEAVPVAAEAAVKTVETAICGAV
jgi:hypothetical protein